MDDSIYRLRDRDVLTICVLTVLALGALMVQSASMGVGGTLHWGLTDRGLKHLIYAGISALVYLGVGRLNPSILARGGRPIRCPAVWGLVIAILLCAAVLVPGVGREVNGARRWLALGPIQLQPSELAKWATVLFLAYWLTERPVDLNRFWKGFIPTAAIVGVVCLLVVIQDFGTAALIGLVALGMMLVGRVKVWHLLVTVPPAMVAGAMFVLHTPYRRRRMTSFLDPWADPSGEGYHMVQSLLSFATGGLTGRGLGAGVQKLGYLPEDTTDFIFSVIGEELGLFGAALTVGLYLGILTVAWRATRTGPPFCRLLAFGVGAMVGLQAAINIAVATVSVPTKGLSLPLVSAGGSGLIVTSAALGLLLAIVRRAEDAAAPQPADSHLAASPAA